MATFHPLGKRLSGEFSLSWAWLRLEAALYPGTPSLRISDSRWGQCHHREPSAVTVAGAVKRLHLCLLCVAPAFPAAAGGPLLAGIWHLHCLFPAACPRLNSDHLQVPAPFGTDAAAAGSLVLLKQLPRELCWGYPVSADLWSSWCEETGTDRMYPQP